MKWTWTLAVACLLATPAFAQAGGGVRAMDANHDGQITRAETEAGRVAMFTRLDSDRDGALNEAERTVGGRMAQGLARGDANGDGRLTRAEAMAQPYRMFDRLDADENDILSAAEIETARQRLNGG